MVCEMIRSAIDEIEERIREIAKSMVPHCDTSRISVRPAPKDSGYDLSTNAAFIVSEALKHD